MPQNKLKAERGELPGFMKNVRRVQVGRQSSLKRAALFSFRQAGQQIRRLRIEDT